MRLHRVAGNRTKVLGCGSALVITLAFSATMKCLGCATVRGPAPTAEDYIQSEQAVIFWDEAQKKEDFIRQADIYSQDTDLGFLVPTPKVPELVEADPRIFQLAADVARPAKVQEIIHKRPMQIFGPVALGPLSILRLPFVSLMSGMSGSTDPGPKIISEQNVAGFHAVTLAAEDSNALAIWLKENNYAWTDQLEAWLRPYMDAGWTVTAFKLIRARPSLPAVSGPATPIVTRAIRMSFATDRPFYPYSEPYSKGRARMASPLGRTLRIALLSSTRMQAALGANLFWRGNLQFAGSPLPDSKSNWKTADWLSYARIMDGRTLPNRLTYWRDDSNPRFSRSDLYFSTAPVQKTFRKTEIDYSIPALHRIDFSRPLSDVVALLIFLLPAAPFYCGCHLMRRTRREEAGRDGSRFSFPPNVVQKFFGIVLIFAGSFYGVGCLAMTYWLHHIFTANLILLPSLCTPPFTIFFGAIFLISVSCGIQVFRPLPQTSKMIGMTLSRYWNYFTATWSLLIGGAFASAMMIALILSFFD